MYFLTIISSVTLLLSIFWGVSTFIAGNPGDEPVFNSSGSVWLDNFVTNLDNKINTLISAENGIKLSSGQAQRICIARCLFSRKNFLIFDESFNNLDGVNREKILTNILENFNNKTIIMITHDLNLLRKFDQILLFKSG